ncbi:hypothetical protein GQ53DRAFT_241228 [Thozetella sp. PMI_491]|nr:hypothetical protein GQ53DRAFT_241228 [Thozetella sp. PMI_491]
MNNAFLPDGFSLTTPDAETPGDDQTPIPPAADSSYACYPNQHSDGPGWLPYFNPPVPSGVNSVNNARAVGSPPPSNQPAYHAMPAHDARAAAAAHHPLGSGSPYNITQISIGSYQQLSMTYREPSLAFPTHSHHPAYRPPAELDAGPPTAPHLPLLQAELGAHASWRAADLQERDAHEYGTPQHGSRADRTAHRREAKGKERFKDRSQPEGTNMSDQVAQGRSRQRKAPFALASSSFIDLAGETSITSGQAMTPLPTPNSIDPFTAPTTPSTVIASTAWSPLSEAATTDSAQVSTSRARNRAAATRCRAKSKAANLDLEDEARLAEARNRELVETREGLKETVWRLNMELLDHHACGDELIDTYIQKSARRRVEQKVKEAAGQEEEDEEEDEEEEEDEGDGDYD